MKAPRNKSPRLLLAPASQGRVWKLDPPTKRHQLLENSPQTSPTTKTDHCTHLRSEIHNCRPRIHCIETNKHKYCNRNQPGRPQAVEAMKISTLVKWRGDARAGSGNFGSARLHTIMAAAAVEPVSRNCYNTINLPHFTNLTFTQLLLYHRSTPAVCNFAMTHPIRIPRRVYCLFVFKSV